MSRIDEINREIAELKEEKKRLEDPLNMLKQLLIDDGCKVIDSEYQSGGKTLLVVVDKYHSDFSCITDNIYRTLGLTLHGIKYNGPNSARTWWTKP